MLANDARLGRRLAWAAALALVGVDPGCTLPREGAGSTSSGADGGATACTPGAQRVCYGGPPGTQGVGICKAGTQTCEADGNGLGACEGQIVPGVEDCGTPYDQNCNGWLGAIRTPPRDES